LVDIKRSLTNASCRVSALEIVTRQIAKFKCNYAIFPRKITASANWSVFTSAMITLYESGDQTIPVYIKKHEFTKLKENREIWYSKPFYLYKGCKVFLCIDTSQCAHDQGPLVELHLLEGSYNESRFPNNGLKLLLVHHNVKELWLMHGEYCVIRDGQKVICTATIPVNAPPDYFRDDSVIILVTCLTYSWPQIFWIGIFFLVMIVYAVACLYQKMK